MASAFSTLCPKGKLKGLCSPLIPGTETLRRTYAVKMLFYIYMYINMCVYVCVYAYKTQDGGQDAVIHVGLLLFYRLNMGLFSEISLPKLYS